MKLLYWLIAIVLSLILTVLISIQAGWAYGEYGIEPLKPAPAGWPKMKIFYVYVSDRNIGVVCNAPKAMACAVPNIYTRLCPIYWSPSVFAKPDWSFEEVAHCNGRKHYD